MMHYFMFPKMELQISLHLELLRGFDSSPLLKYLW